MFLWQSVNHWSKECFLTWTIESFKKTLNFQCSCSRWKTLLIRLFLILNSLCWWTKTNRTPLKHENTKLNSRAMLYRQKRAFTQSWLKSSTFWWNSPLQSTSWALHCSCLKDSTTLTLVSDQNLKTPWSLAFLIFSRTIRPVWTSRRKNWPRPRQLMFKHRLWFLSYWHKTVPPHHL